MFFKNKDESVTLKSTTPDFSYQKHRIELLERTVEGLERHLNENQNKVLINLLRELAKPDLVLQKETRQKIEETICELCDMVTFSEDVINGRN